MGATDGFRTGWLTCDQLDECLDRIRQGRDRHLGVEFDRRGRPQKRLNVSYVRAGLVLLLIGPAVGVVEAGLNALEKDWQRCTEKHDMTEHGVEGVWFSTVPDTTTVSSELRKAHIRGSSQVPSGRTQPP